MANSTTKFNAYHVWLGVAPEHESPNFYQLLNVPEFEPSEQVIENSYNRQMGFLQAIKDGEHLDAAEKLKAELARARLQLLDGAKKSDYDDRLRVEIREREQAAERDQDARFQERLEKRMADEWLRFDAARQARETERDSLEKSRKQIESQLAKERSFRTAAELALAHETQKLDEEESQLQRARAQIGLLVAGLALAGLFAGGLFFWVLPKPKRAPPTGHVRLEISQPTTGLSLQVDETTFTAESLLQPLTLPVGDHFFLATGPTIEPFVESFTVRAGEKTQLPVRWLPRATNDSPFVHPRPAGVGKLKVLFPQTPPTGVVIKVDGKPRNLAELRNGLTLATGTHLLLATGRSTEPFLVPVEIRPDGLAELSVTFKVRSETVAVAPPDKPDVTEPAGSDPPPESEPNRVAAEPATAKEPIVPEVPRRFPNFPTQISLANTNTDTPQELGTVDVRKPGEVCRLRLLGGDGAGKTETFVLKNGQATHLWDVDLKQSLSEQQIVAQLAIRKNKLLFRWTKPGATKAGAAFLQNCSLHLELDGETHIAALRTAASAEPLVAEVKNTQHLVKLNLPALPASKELKVKLASRSPGYTLEPAVLVVNKDKGTIKHTASGDLLVGRVDATLTGKGVDLKVVVQFKNPVDNRLSTLTPEVIEAAIQQIALQQLNAQQQIQVLATRTMSANAREQAKSKLQIKISEQAELLKKMQALLTAYAQLAPCRLDYQVIREVSTERGDTTVELHFADTGDTSGNAASPAGQGSSAEGLPGAEELAADEVPDGVDKKDIVLSTPQLIQDFKPGQSLNYIGLGPLAAKSWRLGNRVRIGQETFTITQIRLAGRNAPGGTVTAFDIVVVEEFPQQIYPRGTRVGYLSPK